MSLEEGFARKREGQAQAISGDVDGWRERAVAAAIELAVDGREFTAEDVTNLVGLPDSDGLVGSVFSQLRRSKQIEWTGEIRQCTREQSHAADQRVWRVYTGYEDRMRRIMDVVERGMQSPEDARFGSTLNRAQKHPLTFANEITREWSR